ncbi:hypothetical protein [Rhizobium sp. LjRoot254]|uniref:hypothetical protein n=1 Tax=Rhizobium sp. LjRoot254 TaxID=3342297 RepID=UPI003ECC3880
MASSHSRYITGKPITVKGRLIISGCILLAALVLGFAISVALYQFNRDLFRKSDALGYALCGEGQHIDDVPSGSKGTRMICRDAAGTEVSARNNMIAVNMALPFIIMLAAPGMLMAWILDFREVKRH